MINELLRPCAAKAPGSCSQATCWWDAGPGGGLGAHVTPGVTTGTKERLRPCCTPVLQCRVLFPCPSAEQAGQHLSAPRAAPGGAVGLRGQPWGCAP